MELIWSELGGTPDLAETVRFLLRLLAAALFGAVIGYEREAAGKEAGLRTHMLVAIGAALFVLAAQTAGVEIGDLSRVIQGVITGIGFIGAGAILKRSATGTVHGLTTAAGVWLTAAVGVAVGLGELFGAALATVAAWLVLDVLGALERRRARRPERDPPD